ncbi:hypothetical protein M2427_006654 [Bradyrhizobium sp. BR13661]|jgi:hypothetical protein|nr:hypothetical protein [Bradyrhizobium sp. BR13661]
MFQQHATIHRGNIGVFARRRRAVPATQCRTFPVEFVYDLSRTHNADTNAGNGGGSDPELHTRAGAVLPNFTSSLHSGFRFGLNRHKYATDLACRLRLREAPALRLETLITRRRVATRVTKPLPKR